MKCLHCDQPVHWAEDADGVRTWIHSDDGTVHCANSSYLEASPWAAEIGTHPGIVATLKACNKCYAIVSYYMLDRHIDWHRQMEGR